MDSEDLKQRAPLFVIVGLALVGFVVLLVFASKPGPPRPDRAPAGFDASWACSYVGEEKVCVQTPRHPVGFSADWACASNGARGGGFCLRKGSPPIAKPAS